MKKSEFKKILRPIVNECIKESLMEDGLISGIIAEVVKGMAPSQKPIVEEPHTLADPIVERMKRNTFSEQQTKLQDHRKKLMAAVGGSSFNGVNLFEGTTPAPSQTSPMQQGDPMSGQTPSDPGVDITKLFGSVGKNWNAHMTNVKEGK
tara:strand:+ start:1088 stop:1534 length:447 start_codon:yes stop_codon:yes gene_type:complete